MAQFIIYPTENPSDLSWISQKWQQPIQRIFWLTDVPSHSIRGGHRHQAECQMVLHCPVGRVEIYVQTPEKDQIYTLKASDEFLFLEGSDWRSMQAFSTNSILTVLTSHSFETTQYVDQPYRAVAVKEVETLV